MKKRFSILAVSVVIAGIALSLVGTALISQAAPEPPVARKIVVFQSGVAEPAKEALMKNFGGEKIKDLPLVNGMAVLLSPQAEKALIKQAGVLRIDNDDVVLVLKGKPTPTPPPPPPAETLSWGVDRINAEIVWGGSEDATKVIPGNNTGLGVNVAILDTGIDIDHPDLVVVGGANVLGPFRTDKYNDDNGHGTHVAGIVAALDNDEGVIGVAPEAKLYAVKAFNRRGIGFDSDIIDGIDWSITNGMQVINMSFGGSDNPSLHQAIQEAYDAGIVMVAAAGNEGTNFIHYPARYPETIAVSATTFNDGLASFSSYATDLAQVEAINLLAAPGKDINSTWNNGGYYVGSGTSMATPHVVGTVALMLKAKSCTPENRLAAGCTPNEMISLLKTNGVEDLGLAGIDVYFGYGLINAEKAVNSVTQ